MAVLCLYGFEDMFTYPVGKVTVFEIIKFKKITLRVSNDFSKCRIFTALFLLQPCSFPHNILTGYVQWQKRHTHLHVAPRDLPRNV